MEWVEFKQWITQTILGPQIINYILYICLLEHLIAEPPPPLSLQILSALIVKKPRSEKRSSIRRQMGKRTGGDQLG